MAVYILWFLTSSGSERPAQVFTIFENSVVLICMDPKLNWYPIQVIKHPIKMFALHVENPCCENSQELAIGFAHNGQLYEWYLGHQKQVKDLYGSMGFKVSRAATSHRI